MEGELAPEDVRRLERLKLPAVLCVLPALEVCVQVPEITVLVALQELRAQDVTAAPEVRAGRALGVRTLRVLTAWGPARWRQRRWRDRVSASTKNTPPMYRNSIKN